MAAIGGSWATPMAILTKGTATPARPALATVPGVYMTVSDDGVNEAALARKLPVVVTESYDVRCVGIAIVLECTASGIYVL